MRFPRQEYWSGLPFPSPGDLPNPGMEPASPALAEGFFTIEPPETPWYSPYHGGKTGAQESPHIVAVRQPLAVMNILTLMLFYIESLFYKNP